MLGTLFWDGDSKCCDIKEAKQTLVVQGVTLEAKVEANGLLRLSKVVIVNTEIEQHVESMSNIENELRHRIVELAKVEKEYASVVAQRIDPTD